MPCGKPYAGYEGLHINETIRINDHITFTYCDRYANSTSYQVTAPVIKVEAGDDGTGLNGSVMVNLNGSPTPIMDDQKIRRAKYVNNKGNLVDVPNWEGREGFIAEFATLISGGDDYAISDLVGKKGNWFCSKLKKGGDEALKKAYGSNSKKD